MNCNNALNRSANADKWFAVPFAGFPAFGRYATESLNKPLVADVHEDVANFYASFEVPGVKKDAVKIELNNRLLSVTVEKKEKRGDNESSYTLTRSISVPDSVKADEIGAKLEDGILTVTLPKAEERKPRAITVA
jgi:HSP20 family protein